MTGLELELWTAMIGCVVSVAVLLFLAAACTVALVMDWDSKLTFDEFYVPVLCLLAGRAARRRLHQILDARPCPPDESVRCSCGLPADHPATMTALTRIEPDRHFDAAGRRAREEFKQARQRAHATDVLDSFLADLRQMEQNRPRLP